MKLAYHGLRSAVLGAACRVSPRLIMRFRHRLGWGRWPDLGRPGTFDEKLQWLNLFWRHPLKTRCGDKFTLRAFAEEARLGHLLPTLFGVYRSPAEIEIDGLPPTCVLKCSHGCKCNVFVRDKEAVDWDSAKVMLAGWMRTDYSLLLGELHYHQMAPRIICEEFLADDTGQDLPRDYKVFCFGGTPHCTMAATARDRNGIARLAFYDLAWKRRLEYCLPELAAEEDIPRPQGYEEMLQSAAILSRPFPFVRVDFYSIKGRARLGEMTFTPGACVSADYMTTLAQEELGRLIRLPEPHMPERLEC